MAKYSLSKYIATISIPTALANSFGLSSISVGGSGSYTDSITLNFNDDMWKVEGDVTGSYVMNRSDNKTGTIELSVSQVSDRVRQLITLCNIYKSSDQIDEGLTIEVRSTNGTMIATCLDCMPQRIPSQVMGQTAANQTWTFVSGEITIH